MAMAPEALAAGASALPGLAEALPGMAGALTPIMAPLGGASGPFALGATMNGLGAGGGPFALGAITNGLPALSSLFNRSGGSPQGGGTTNTGGPGGRGGDNWASFNPNVNNSIGTQIGGIMQMGGPGGPGGNASSGGGGLFNFGSSSGGGRGAPSNSAAMSQSNSNATALSRSDSSASAYSSSNNAIITPPSPAAIAGLPPFQLQAMKVMQQPQMQQLVAMANGIHPMSGLPPFSGGGGGMMPMQMGGGNSNGGGWTPQVVQPGSGGAPLQGGVEQSAQGGSPPIMRMPSGMPMSLPPISAMQGARAQQIPSNAMANASGAPGPPPVGSGLLEPPKAYQLPYDSLYAGTPYGAQPGAEPSLESPEQVMQWAQGHAAAATADGKKAIAKYTAAQKKLDDARPKAADSEAEIQRKGRERLRGLRQRSAEDAIIDKMIADRTPDGADALQREAHRQASHAFIDERGLPAYAAMGHLDALKAHRRSIAKSAATVPSTADNIYWNELGRIPFYGPAKQQHIVKQLAAKQQMLDTQRANDDAEIADIEKDQKYHQELIKEARANLRKDPSTELTAVTKVRTEDRLDRVQNRLDDQEERNQEDKRYKENSASLARQLRADLAGARLDQGQAHFANTAAVGKANLGYREDANRRADEAAQDRKDAQPSIEEGRQTRIDYEKWQMGGGKPRAFVTDTEWKPFRDKGIPSPSPGQTFDDFARGLYQLTLRKDHPLSKAKAYEALDYLDTKGMK